jgi:hypothetical protein
VINRPISSDSTSGRSKAWMLQTALVLGCLATIPSCLSLPNSGSTPSLPFAGHTEEGLLSLRDGEDVQITFKRPFESPPRMSIVEVRQSAFDRLPYSKSDFRFVKIDATCFKVENTHPEQRMGSVATFKWRAEGILAKEKQKYVDSLDASTAQDSKAAQDKLVARIKKAGGTATVNALFAKNQITGIDVHRTHFTDADLMSLKNLSNLTTLNLYGTRITDAGLRSLSGLTNLHVLHLNDTAITDAGLEHLQALTNLTELGLNNTHVTDEGLYTLRKLVNLKSLALSGPQITDRGIAHLSTLHDLKQLTLSETGVTEAGTQRLKMTLKKVNIIFSGKPSK